MVSHYAKRLAKGAYNFFANLPKDRHLGYTVVVSSFPLANIFHVSSYGIHDNDASWSQGSKFFRSVDRHSEDETRLKESGVQLDGGADRSDGTDSRAVATAAAITFFFFSFITFFVSGISMYIERIYRRAAAPDSTAAIEATPCGHALVVYTVSDRANEEKRQCGNVENFLFFDFVKFRVENFTLKSLEE